MSAGRKNLSAYYLIGTILISAVSVGMVIFIVVQESKSGGLGSEISGGSQTYWTRNRARSKEGKLVKITIVLAVIFFIAAIGLTISAFTGL